MTARDEFARSVRLVPETEIFRIARVLIDRHAGEATAVARQRASDFLAGGDHGGHAVWVRVATAIATLLRTDGTRH